jgi:hypothetical protein
MYTIEFDLTTHISNLLGGRQRWLDYLCTLPGQKQCYFIEQCSKGIGIFMGGMTPYICTGDLSVFVSYIYVHM